MRVIVLLLVLGLLLAGCGGDEASPTTTPPSATMTPTSGPESSPTVASPSPTPSATATPPSGDLPRGERTGIPEVDAVLDVLAAEDRDAFESLLTFTEAPCTNAQGLGGPPKCFHFPGSPQEGTVVEAFYLSTCEGEWRTDLEPIADNLFSYESSLYAVVELNLDAPLWDEPYMPQPEYGVILSHTPAGASDNPEPVGVLLGVEAGGGITYIDYVCIGPPDFFLSPASAPAYGEDMEVILRGPAFP